MTFTKPQKKSNFIDNSSVNLIVQEGWLDLRVQNYFNPIRPGGSSKNYTFENKKLRYVLFVKENNGKCVRCNQDANTS